MQPGFAIATALSTTEVAAKAQQDPQWPSEESSPKSSQLDELPQ